MGENEADALAIANDTPYGLTAYIWTNDAGRALRMAHQPGSACQARPGTLDATAGRLK